MFTYNRNIFMLMDEILRVNLANKLLLNTI